MLQSIKRKKGCKILTLTTLFLLTTVIYAVTTCSLAAR
jgi:hypothetical protein